jgi:thiol-disulfide isomerase/thioredoxin
MDGEGDNLESPSTLDAGPTAPACHAYASTPTEELAGTGNDLGDTAYNFELMDQHGDRVSLYDFHGCVVVLDLLTQWCAPCQDAAPLFETLHQERGPDVVVIAVMLQTTDGGPPALEHVQWWADTFGLTYPVLADPYASQYNYTGGSFPTVVVLDRGMTLVHEDWDPDDVDFLDSWL